METAESVFGIIPFMIVLCLFVVALIGLYTHYLSVNEMLDSTRYGLTTAEAILERLSTEPGIISPPSQSGLDSLTGKYIRTEIKVEYSGSQISSTNYNSMIGNDAAKSVITLPVLVGTSKDNKPGRITVVSENV